MTTGAPSSGHQRLGVGGESARLARDSALLGHGLSELRALVARVVDAGLNAADPRRAARAALVLDGEDLHIGGRHLPLSRYRNIWLLGAGKASGALAQGVEDRLGERITGGLVVVRRGAGVALRRARVIEADHPLPSEASLAAGEELFAVAATVGEDDLVISCVTGGSSALVCLPARGIPPADKRELHRLLLTSGADIREINTVRKHASAIKGGRLAAALAPATILNLSVSDVAGDPVEYICDLTVSNEGAARDAIEVLERHGLWCRVPSSVRLHLEANPDVTLPDLEGLDISTHMLVTAEQVVRAMVEEAAENGVPAVVLGTELAGPAGGLGAVLAGLARECARHQRPFPPPVVLLACGGEATVQLPCESDFGAGGPNQELATAAATALSPGDPVVVAAIDTDGSDGGTEAAGAMVDSTTLGRAVSLGVDLHGALREHRTRAALAAIGDLVVTGPTQTNVNDLVVVAVGDGSPRPAG